MFIYFLANPEIRYKREIDEKSEGVSLDNNERYIESLVVVDQKMCNYHGEDAATQFTMAVLNMVCSLIIIKNHTNHSCSLARRFIIYQRK